VADIRFPDEGLGPLRAPPPVPRPVADERPEALYPAALSPDLVRRAQALARWRRRSEQIRFFRKALPAAMIGIVVFGAGWVGVRSIISALSQAEELGSIHLINPTFYGRNDKGELYIMSAREAVRQGDDPDRIALTAPDLKQYPVGAPEPMTTHALHGVYHEQKRLLDLTGRVVATDGRGNTFTSEFAHVDMPKNSVVGNSHVYSYGPQGSISADSYQVYDKGQHAIFTGHTKTHLTNQPAPKLPPRPAAQPVLPAGAIPVPYKLLGHSGPVIRPPL
jgi:lipopolysaccharide export system protein LptC